MQSLGLELCFLRERPVHQLPCFRDTAAPSGSALCRQLTCMWGSSNEAAKWKSADSVGCPAAAAAPLGALALSSCALAACSAASACLCCAMAPAKAPSSHGSSSLTACTSAQEPVMARAANVCTAVCTRSQHGAVVFLGHVQIDQTGRWTAPTYFSSQVGVQASRCLLTGSSVRISRCAHLKELSMVAALAALLSFLGT